MFWQMFGALWPVVARYIDYSEGFCVCCMYNILHAFSVLDEGLRLGSLNPIVRIGCE